MTIALESSGNEVVSEELICVSTASDALPEALKLQKGVSTRCARKQVQLGENEITPPKFSKTYSSYV